MKQRGGMIMLLLKCTSSENSHLILLMSMVFKKRIIKTRFSDVVFQYNRPYKKSVRIVGRPIFGDTGYTFVVTPPWYNQYMYISRYECGSLPI